MFQASASRQFFGANLGQFLIINVHPLGVGSSEQLLWPRFARSKTKNHQGEFNYIVLTTCSVFKYLTKENIHTYIMICVFWLTWFCICLFSVWSTCIQFICILMFFFRVCKPCRDYFPQSWNTMFFWGEKGSKCFFHIWCSISFNLHLHFVFWGEENTIIN